MTTEDWERVKQIVAECLERPAADRPGYIAEACAGNAAITAEVQSLIASVSEAGEFLETPMVEHAQPEDLQARQQIGSYQVLELIGRGGMGSVYRAARSSDFRKEVAIKVVKRGMDTEFILERFRQERQILAALDHPNIARLLDGGATVDGRPYIVMELITGRPITEYAAAHGLAIEKRLRLFQTVCSAVQHAHQNLIVHRDLKAGNILVTPDGSPKLLDFGIAKLLASDSERTSAVVRLLTPECASPEQVRGEPLNTLTDIYSLGVLLYELLTEAKPYQFSSADPAEIQRVICEQEPARPGAIRPLAAELDNIVLKAMHKDPSHRYVSAAQISEDIDRFLSGKPVIARRDTARYRASKFVKRHVAATLAAAVVVVSLAAGLGVALWEAHLARIQRERADRRFSDVRHMANSLLFDIHDAIKDLPGATPARKLIVDRALQYLDKLAQEQGRDPGLEEDLAAAYIKVADVQGGANYANLGDSAGALANYQKALHIRRELAAANPSDVAVRRHLAEVYNRIARQQLWFGDIAEATNAVHQALDIYQAIVDSPGHTPEDRLHLSADYEFVGDLQSGDGPSGSLDDDHRALEYHRKALAISSGKPEDNSALARHVRAVTTSKIATDLTRLGERAEALRLFAESLAVFESLASSGNTLAQSHVPVLQGRIGDNLMMSGDPGAALVHYRNELEAWRSQLARDPQNAILRAGVAAALGSVGFALARSGHLAEGIRNYQAAEEILRNELAVDKESALNRSTLAMLLIWSSEACATTGNKAQAADRANEAAGIYQSLVKAVPRDAAARLNLAASRNVLGGIWIEQGSVDQARNAFQDAVKLAEPSGGPNGTSEQAKYVLADAYAGMGSLSARSGSMNEAQTWFRRSASVWTTVAHPGALSPNGFPTPGPAHVRAELARIDSALARH